MAARKGAQAVRPMDSEPRWPAWVWLLLGVGLGLAIAGFAWMKDWWPAHAGRGPQPNPAAQAPQNGEPAVAEDKPAKPEPSKPKYDFYSVLPEMEVVIPDAEVRAKAQEAKAQQGKTPLPATPGASTSIEPTGLHYWLQAGSFRDTKQAEELKAKLALMGLRAQVADVTINGTAWYRVRVGPYASAVELDSGKRTLETNGVAAIALKEAGQ